MKKNRVKKLVKVSTDLLVGMLVCVFVWGCISWCEVVIKNDITKAPEDRVISDYNLFNLLLNQEEEYTKEGIVTGKYTVKDSRGEEWATSEPVGYEVGTEVVITFTDNKTDNKFYDDGIVRLDLKV